MKRLSIVLLSILLGFTLIACAEPDIASDKENREISFVISKEIFPEDKMEEITQIEFSYEEIAATKAFIEPIRIDVASDGKIDPIKITVKKGSSINYKISALDSKGVELWEKSGKITPAEGKDTINVVPRRDITFKVTIPPDWNGPQPIAQYALYINGLQWSIVGAQESGPTTLYKKNMDTSIDNTYKIEAKNSKGIVVAVAEGILVFDDSSICNIPMPSPIAVKD